MPFFFVMTRRPPKSTRMDPLFPHTTRLLSTPDEWSGAVGEFAVLDHGSLARGAWDIGQSGAASGRAVIEWIRLAEQLARNGEIDGWIMAPVDSQSLKASGEISSIDRKSTRLNSSH